MDNQQSTLREITSMPTIVREYYEAERVTEMPSFDEIKVASLSRIHPDLIAMHSISLTGCCSFEEYAIRPPSRNDLIEHRRAYARSIGGRAVEIPYIEVLENWYIHTTKAECPNCKALRKKQHETEKRKAKERKLAKRQAEIDEIKAELDSDPAKFWYYRIINQNIKNSHRCYDDKGYFQREIVPLAAECPPYKFAAIVSYCFYKADIIVTESPYPKCFSTTVKSLMKRFTPCHDTWKINYRYEPETLMDEFLKEYPELIDICANVLESLIISHHDELIEKSSNVVRLNHRSLEGTGI